MKCFNCSFNSLLVFLVVLFFSRNNVGRAAGTDSCSKLRFHSPIEQLGFSSICSHNAPDYLAMAIPSVDGKETNLSITLGRRETAENEATPAQPGQPEAPAQVLGMTLAPLDESMRAEMGLADDAQGLVVQSLDETGDAWDKGLRPGDVITEAGQQPVAQVGDLNSRIDEAREAGRKSVLLLVRRGGEPRFVALSVN